MNYKKSIIYKGFQLKIEAYLNYHPTDNVYPHQLIGYSNGKFPTIVKDVRNNVNSIINGIEKIKDTFYSLVDNKINNSTNVNEYDKLLLSLEFKKI